MPLVTDISSLVGMVLEDEDADYAESVIEAVARGGAVVPCLFWFEARNVLVVNERRGRLKLETTVTFLEALEDLPFEVEGLPADPAVLDVARRYGLSVYDAAYLELTIRRKLPLATLDRKLQNAATAAGVTLYRPL